MNTDGSDGRLSTRRRVTFARPVHYPVAAAMLHVRRWRDFWFPN